MSSEIVPALDGSRRTSSAGIRPFDLRTPWNAMVTVNLIGGNYHTKRFLGSGKGHQHITQSNPTPASVQHVLDNIEEPSVLRLRGCGELLIRADFPFQKFHTLTSLEISGCTHLTLIPERAISEMTQLQSLNLSRLPIKQLPHDFFSYLTKLRSIVLRCCPNLDSTPPGMALLPRLEYLDLSYLPIKSLPYHHLADASEYLQLRSVFFRGCYNLTNVLVLNSMTNLEEIDLSHCTALRSIPDYWPNKIQKLDVSYTPGCFTLDLCSYSLTHLFLRGSKEYVLDELALCTIKVLDLSEAQNVRDVNELKSSRCLEALDLSATGIESIDVISNLTSLGTLILRECTGLVRLPSMGRLTKLEALDISGCVILVNLPDDLCNLRSLKRLNLSKCSGLTKFREGVFDQMSSCLEQLDLSHTNIMHLPCSFESLASLQTLNISHTPMEQVLDLSYLTSLRELVLTNRPKLLPCFPPRPSLKIVDLDQPGNEGIDFQQVVVGDSSNIPTAQEFHLVSTFISNSGFDRFRYEFTKLGGLISTIKKNFNSTNMKSLVFKRHFGSMHDDLKYILQNIDLLESLTTCNRSEKLLIQLLDFANSRSSTDAHSLDSIKLNQFLMTIVKLKILIEEREEEEEEQDEDDDEASEVEEEAEANISLLEKKKLLGSSYESLTDTERNCLLYFAVFPSKGGYVIVKESILIQLWYGEGFIDPISNPNSITTPNLEVGTSIDTSDQAIKDASQQVATIKTVESLKPFKEIGINVLKVLQEKGFIQTNKGKKCMEEVVHLFVKAQAKEVQFFDFDQENGELTPHFTVSNRACLLKSRHNLPSSCQLWLDYTDSSEKLECFKTLLNVNDSMIDIRTEWFSKMRSLQVLHLVSLRGEGEKDDAIDVMNLNFLEELKNMKQLRLLKLKGITAITRLPNAICKLTNLKILNLSDCSNLEELPTDIASLKSLTHIDLTHCHVLHKLPKGVSLLSKLEVLKGFVINYQVGGLQHKKACTLSDLLKLESLRKLNLVVNRDTFPESKDRKVFNQMKNLYNLKITWEKNCSKFQEAQDSTIVHDELNSLRHSKWQQLKCWQQQAPQNDAEQPLRSNPFSNLKKLALCCFPSKACPDWLDPAELQNLEKLCIVGWRELETLRPQKWNDLKSLQMKYLPKVLSEMFFKMTHIFPNVSYLEIHGCANLPNYLGIVHS